MGIRKYGGQATGDVTGIEQDGITAEAARRPDWDERDDQALERENTAADDSTPDDD